MAFAVFADAPVDVAVIEVGMGGTWDNTNVADGAVAVVTPISIDHSRYLGNTVDAIAADKAGIIKPGAIAVLAQQPLEAAEVLLHRVAEVGATVAREGLEFGVTSRELAVGGQLVSIRGLLGEYSDLFLPLFGRTRPATRLAHWPRWKRSPGRARRRGRFRAAGRRTGPGGIRDDVVAGPLEIVRAARRAIVDAAHNPAGMAASHGGADRGIHVHRSVGIMAVSEDKDVPGILDELEPAVSGQVVTSNSSTRSMRPAAVAEMATAVFGPDRVRQAAAADDAIEIGVGAGRRRGRPRPTRRHPAGWRLRAPGHRFGDHRRRCAGAARRQGRDGSRPGRRESGRVP